VAAGREVAGHVVHDRGSLGLGTCLKVSSNPTPARSVGLSCFSTGFA
jgi:hypothetical protein